MQAITLEVILRAVFGVSDGSAARAPARPAARSARRDVGSGRCSSACCCRAGSDGPDPLARLVRCARGSTSARGGDRRRADPLVGEREDILSLLVAARFEDGSAMDDGELRDQLLTLLLAGHETTATALAWTFDLLLRHPAALARLTASFVDGGRRVPAGGGERGAAPAAGRAAGRAAPRTPSCASAATCCPSARTSRRRSG